MFVRACNEAHVLPATADELEVSVLLHPPLPGLEIPEANLLHRSGGGGGEGSLSRARLMGACVLAEEQMCGSVKKSATNVVLLRQTQPLSHACVPGVTATRLRVFVGSW